MTGFGAATARAGAVRVRVELSSVNRKQLDVAVRLPPAFAALEAPVQKRIQAAVSRGRISGAVTVEQASSAAARQADLRQAEEQIGRLRRLAHTLNLQDDLSASALLQLPGVLKNAAAEPSEAALRPALDRALDGALNKLDAMRRREGRALQADLLARLKELERMLAGIKARAPQIPEKYRRRLIEGLAQAGLPLNACDERVIREIALFAERCDIAEEITRLTSHIQQFKQALRGGQPAGRTLDFLAQELFREINTIGSKANDLEITGAAVRFKTELERIREQIQNLE